MEVQFTLQGFEKSVIDNGRGALTMRLLESNIPRATTRKKWIDDLAGRSQTKWKLKGLTICFEK